MVLWILNSPFAFSYQEYDGGDKMEFPNFNFNASHHGDYVAIASEPLCLVGLDIVSYKPPQKETILEFIQNFASYFSSLEWSRIMSAGTPNEVLVEFYRYNWSLRTWSYRIFPVNFPTSLEHSHV